MKAKIDIGDPARDFATGDYINALDEVTAEFLHHREITVEQICAALKAYSDYVEETQ